MFHEVQEYFRARGKGYSGVTVLLGQSCGPGTKKDGNLRFCIDFRKLNAWTVKDLYALPPIEETLNVPWRGKVVHLT